MWRVVLKEWDTHDLNAEDGDTYTVPEHGLSQATNGGEDESRSGRACEIYS